MMIVLQTKSTLKISIWGWTKNSSNLYYEWVHHIFLIDYVPEAACFYFNFNFSLIAKESTSCIPSPFYIKQAVGT